MDDISDVEVESVLEEKLSDVTVTNVWSSYIFEQIEQADPVLLIGVGVAIFIVFITIGERA